MPFQIVRDDITRMHVDAIVNAANEQLRHGGGVCGAIFAAAGASDLEAACAKIGHCETGSAVATPAFALPARHVIHTVGPIWRGGAFGEEQALRSCYRTSLELALELGDASIAVPLISSGIYGYPKEAAINVAIDEIRTFLLDEKHEMDVYLALFDQDSMRVARNRFGAISSLIYGYPVQSGTRHVAWEDSFDDSSYFGPSRVATPMAPSPPFSAQAAPSQQVAPPQSKQHAQTKPKRTTSLRHSLDVLLKRVDAGFSQTLLTMIDKRGLKDSEVYKRANMSRQHFSKIRNNPRYQPKKATVLALCVALQLSPADTRLLLERAGFTLTHSDARDIVVEYFIEKGFYDIYEINLALYAYDLPLLG